MVRREGWGSDWERESLKGNQSFVFERSIPPSSFHIPYHITRTHAYIRTLYVPAAVCERVDVHIQCSVS